jgi:hypothetical protein
VRCFPDYMLYYTLKILLSAFIIVAVSEIAKRSSLLGALLASLPLTSLLAFVWLYLDTGDVQQVASLSSDIFWLVLPSLPLFLVLPTLLKMGWGFWPGLAVAMLITAGCYGIMLLLFKQFAGQS